jgi:hypothetical protein
MHGNDILLKYFVIKYSYYTTDDFAKNWHFIDESEDTDTQASDWCISAPIGNNVGEPIKNVQCNQILRISLLGETLSRRLMRQQATHTGQALVIIYPVFMTFEKERMA